MEKITPENTKQASRNRNGNKNTVLLRWSNYVFII